MPRTTNKIRAPRPIIMGMRLRKGLLDGAAGIEVGATGGVGVSGVAVGGA